MTRYRPHSVVVRLLDTTRTDRLEQVQTITTHRMSFESTTSSLKQKAHQYRQQFHRQKDYTTHLVCRQLIAELEVNQQQTSDGS